MSILRAEEQDFAITGRTLPAGEYVATVLDARVEKTENGTRLTRMYGNIRTRAGEVELPATNGGASFRIGNRKLFARSWIDHTNEQAAHIGQREIKHEAVSAGLMRKPAKGETVELDFDSFDAYADALLGKDVTVRTAIRVQWKDAQTGTILKNPTPEQMKGAQRDEQAEIRSWLQP